MVSRRVLQRHSTQHLKHILAYPDQVTRTHMQQLSVTGSQIVWYYCFGT